MEFERVGLAVISAARVGLLNGQLRAVECRNAENHFGIVFHRGEETNGDFLQVGGIAVRLQVRRTMVFERVFLRRTSRSRAW